MSSARDPRDVSDFAERAAGPDPGLVLELRDFLRHNKKWWLLPILLVLAAVGVLLLLSTSVVAPFIYPLF